MAEQAKVDRFTSGVTRSRWPLAGVAAGVLGILGTLITDIHVEGDGTRGDVVTMADVTKIDQMTAHLSIVFGFLAVTALLVLAACWRKSMEPMAPDSIAARTVTQCLTAAAGALSLGYGWKGATAIYHADGMDSGTYDDMGLYVYYILNDFGSYIGWFGVTVAAGAVAWMSLKERVLPIWIGVWSLLPVLAVIGFTGGTGLPGFPGVVSPIWMVVAFTGLMLVRWPVPVTEVEPVKRVHAVGMAD
ncbi:MAG TPA: hypothetical protein VD767_11905 [Thermomicrobiales bacterium]|nr:hypothetical protein [Thermomicrobiales bacterium]